MRAREIKKKDRETRALLVLDVVKKSLVASAEQHAKLKVANDLMIEVAEDVLDAPT